MRAVLMAETARFDRSRSRQASDFPASYLPNSGESIYAGEVPKQNLSIRKTHGLVCLRSHSLSCHTLLSMDRKS